MSETKRPKVNEEEDKINEWLKKKKLTVEEIWCANGEMMVLCL